MHRSPQGSSCAAPGTGHWALGATLVSRSWRLPALTAPLHLCREFWASGTFSVVQPALLTSRTLPLHPKPAPCTPSQPGRRSLLSVTGSSPALGTSVRGILQDLPLVCRL